MRSATRSVYAMSRCRPRPSASGKPSSRTRPSRLHKETTMYQFNYHKASSLADATSAAAKSSDARLLAGGQTLLASMKLRLVSPADVIDLSGVPELKGIKVDGSTLTIGAMTR